MELRIVDPGEHSVGEPKLTLGIDLESQARRTRLALAAETSEDTLNETVRDLRGE